MFHMKYLFYFIFIHWIVAIPQLNLYFTNEVSEVEYDEIGVRYTCLRLTANMKYASVLREISSYCISESPSKFHIENEDNSFEKFYFEDLVKKNISSEELYLWSTPIDIIEQYQIYLELNESSLAKHIVYNCTLPLFGSMCQYELYYYHENYSSLYEIIYDYYRSYPYKPTTNMTCYTHLKCNRGYAPACLDWTEICDGKVDCLDGEYDEEHCWQFELNECKQNEYYCSLGQCISYEFVHDDPDHPDCLDTTDENMRKNYLAGECNSVEPIIACEDIRCQNTFFTSSCVGQRNHVLIKSMFSIKDISVSDECWSAFKCYFAFSIKDYHPIDTIVIEDECIPTIKEKCPDMLYVPNIPTFFGHIYTAYKKNDRPYAYNVIFPYLCSNKSFHHESLELVSDISLNNTICYKTPRFDSVYAINGYSWISRYQNFMNNIFLILRKHNPIINFPRNQCNSSIVYQCINSSKCISYYRLMNGITDCPYNDDENTFEDANLHIYPQLKFNYYKCHFTNKYILQSAIFNGQCDCGYNENQLCEDEHLFENFTQRTISFQTICDIHTELYPIIIDKQNYTDETECEKWECNNIYTRCNNVWNCLNGEDEINCDSSSLLFNCSSDYRICVQLDTYKLTCLPVNKINDGHVDCFGGTDEPKLCMIKNLFPKETFYCMNSTPKTCIDPISLCTGFAYCPNKDDEEFCQKNRSIPIYHSICNVEYTSFRSNFEKFLCDTSKYKQTKATKKYFRINGFNESYENKLINIMHLYDNKPIGLLDKSRCHRGINLRVWLNKSSNNYTSTCLCPSSYYGNQCQYQNERLTLSIRFRVSTHSMHIQFAILILLIDNSDKRIIHSYEQFTYLSIRDCKIKYYFYLHYANRPKQTNKTYSIHIDIYEKSSLKNYRGSFFYPVKYLFLPVYRLSLIIDIPSDNYNYNYNVNCLNNKCLNGKCIEYINEKKTFCQCYNGWYGEYCHIKYNCTCSFNSLCQGLLNNNQSICICPINKFGSRCYIQNKICENSKCQNNGTCIPNDDIMLSNNNKYICICQKGFSGNQCEIIDNQIDFIFDKDMDLSQSIFIHFIRIIPYDEYSKTIPEISPQRSTTLQTVSQSTNTVRIYWSQPFHMIFIETLDKKYYLTYIQPNYKSSIKIVENIHHSNYCPSINILMNKTYSEFHIIRRIKSYHLICKNSSQNLLCFHDDIHLCLCYEHENKRLANCFNFDHKMKFDCFGQSSCENAGQCFYDTSDCPKRFICVCHSCYYGSRCQFSTSQFGLSLDAILAYHIIPNVNIINQTLIVKISLSLTIIFIILGIINGIFSLITFKNKKVREVGCGIYLFGSSITTLLTMLLFGLKYFIYLSTQISLTSNELFLKFQCYSLDFFLRICLNMDQWLDACVALERTITVIQGTQFNKNKSKKLAKKILIILLILIISTSIHDPIYRRLFKEENFNDNTIRIWCIVTYTSNIQIYNRILNTFHFLLPFIINFISSIILVTKKSHQKFRLNKNRRYKDILREQIREHQHLLIAPFVLFILALPRLILSYLYKCMNSTKDSWLFLMGYFISFIPSMITFIIFVLPSEFYRKECQKTILRYRKRISQRFHRTLLRL